MRLEVEPNASGFTPLDGNVNQPNSQEKFAEYLNAGIKAAQSGDRKSARRNLMSALDIDAQSENAWLWLASISEYPEELLVFLNNVLDINPNNERALQWSASTKLLLSKTLVQRGVDAHENGRRDFAVQCLDQALSYDMQNVNAWLWLAALAENDDRRMEYFRRVLELEPENEAARSAVSAAEAESRSAVFANAAYLALSSDPVAANESLNKIFERWPDDKDSWILRSHLVVSFEDKRNAWLRILEIDHDDHYAAASLESLKWLEENAKQASKPVVIEKAEGLAHPVADVEEPMIVGAPENAARLAAVESATETPTVETYNESWPANDLPYEYPTVDAFSVPDEVMDSMTSNSATGKPEHTDEAELLGSMEEQRSNNDEFASVAEHVELVSEPSEQDERPKILVVENNPTARKLMAGKLEKSGYSVICAESGREAIELAVAVSPSLVLADIGMPGMDGYAICRTLRDRNETGRIPVVLISGKGGFYEEDLGEAAGANGFITKPFGPETLMKTVELHIADDAAPN